MNKLLPLLLLALLSGGAHGAINEHVQSALDYGSGTTRQIDGTGAAEDDWATPTTGNILIGVHMIRGNGTATNTVDTPSGWTRLEDVSNSSNNNRMSIATFCKIAASGDGDVSFTGSGATAGGVAGILEVAATDLDADCANVVTGEDHTEWNDATASSHGFGSPTAAESSGVAVFISCSEDYLDWAWDGDNSIDGGFTFREDGAGAGRGVCTFFTDEYSTSGSKSATHNSGGEEDRVSGFSVLIESDTAATTWTDTTVDIDTQDMAGTLRS
jgi:hypothetical protein